MLLERRPALMNNTDLEILLDWVAVAVVFADEDVPIRAGDALDLTPKTILETGYEDAHVRKVEWVVGPDQRVALEATQRVVGEAVGPMEEVDRAVAVAVLSLSDLEHVAVVRREERVV